MENVLRPLIVLGGSVVLTLLIGWAVDLLLRRADARHSETGLWGRLRRARVPFQFVLCVALLRGSYDQAQIAREYSADIGRILTLVLIGSTAWLIVGIATAIVETSYSRYANAHRDPARVRRVRTQVTLIQRVVSAIVGVVAVAAMLLTFPAMRAAGASLLASAGILGIVAGVAAQSTLANMFAGLQIAFGDMVRLGDTVVVDGEWGTVDEITLTFLTVRTWDERRITMPVSYFVSKPFENWSRGSADDRHRLLPARPLRTRGRDARAAAGHPARVPGLGRPRLRTGRHGLDTQHHGGTRPGHRQGRRRHLDGTGHGPRADDPLADREAPLRAPRVNTADAALPPGHPNGQAPRPDRGRAHEPPPRTGPGRG